MPMGLMSKQPGRLTPPGCCKASTFLNSNTPMTPFSRNHSESSIFPSLGLGQIHTGSELTLHHSQNSPETAITSSTNTLISPPTFNPSARSPSQGVPQPQSSSETEAPSLVHKKSTIVTWLKETYEVRAGGGSLTKEQLYEDYAELCQRDNRRPLAHTLFGKVVHKAFPGLQSNRLGSRGKTKHCYKNLTKTATTMSSPSSVNNSHPEDMKQESHLGTKIPNLSHFVLGNNPQKSNHNPKRTNSTIHYYRPNSTQGWIREENNKKKQLQLHRG